MLYQTLKLHNGRSDVTLTTYILQPNEFMPEGKRPAVLICPGGGYLVCSDGEGEPIAIAFNRMGYNAFVLRYSVYSGVSGSSESVAAPGANGPSAVREPRDHCVFPNPMLDVKAAMEEIQRNAVQWNTDPTQIALCGFSAGAHNVGIYSTYWKRMGMPKPIGTILGYPLADTRDNLREGMSDFERQELQGMNIAMYGVPVPDDEAMDRTSIPKQISADTVPMFIWNTSEDTMVMPVNSLHIAETLSRHHVPFELHTFENGPHGLSAADESSAIAKSFVRPDVAQWLSLADTWLKKRMHISIPESGPF